MSNHAGAVPDWMTQDYFQERLRTLYGNDTIALQCFDVSPGSSPGDNYACQIFRIKLEFQKDHHDMTLGLIAKYLPKTDTVDMLTKTLDFFKIELSMLTKTLPELSRKFPNMKSFFPKSIFADEEHKIIYMEDLKERGFVMKDKMNRLLDLQHTRLVIKALATLHAHSYLFGEEKPEFKDKYRDIMWQKGGFTEVLIKTSLAQALNAMDRWPINDETKAKLRRLESKLCDMFCDIYKRREESFNVLLHGDCWVNNFLFRYVGNGSVEEVTLLDFQLCNNNSIGLDLNYFLFTSTKLEVLTDHRDAILELYYQTFVDITGVVPGFSLEVVRKEFFERLTLGFACFLLFRPGVVSTKEFDLDGIVKGEADASNDVYLSEEYIKEVVTLWPVFEDNGII